MSSNARLYVLIAFFVVLVGAVWWLLGDHGPDEGSRTPESEPKPPRVAEEAATDAPRQTRTDVEDEQDKTDLLASAAGMTKRESRRRPERKPQLTGDGVIRGAVMDKRGRAVSDATITLLAEEYGASVVGQPSVVYGDVVQADAKGKYEATGLPLDKQYRLKAAAPSGFSVKRTYLIDAAPEREVNFTLEDGGSIEGWVRNEAGEPIADASLYPSQREGQDGGIPGQQGQDLRSITDDEGHFALHAGVGSWRLFVKADGYATMETPSFPIGTRDAEIVLTRGGSASGTVLHEGTGDPLPDVSILAQSKVYWQNLYRTSTNAQGEFVIEALQAGDYTVAVDDNTYMPARGDVSFSIVGEQETSGLVLHAAEGGAVTGRIYDSETHEGLSGVEIVAWVTSRQAFPRSGTSDADGYYRIGGLATDGYGVGPGEVEGYPRSSWQQHRNVSVVAGETTDGIDFPVSRGLALRGVVLDERGAPVEKARVVAAREHGGYMDSSGTTNSNGEFALYGFEAGQSVLLRASKGEQISKQVGPIVVDARGNRDLEIRLEAGAAVAGIVVDGHGTLLANMDVFAAPQFSYRFGRSEARSDAGGKFKLTGLPAGKYQLFARVPESRTWGGESGVEIALEAGETKTGVRLVYDTSSKVEISGKVTDQAGNPIADAIINAHGQGGRRSYGYAQTGADGNYAIKGLEEVEHSMSVNHHAFTSERREGVVGGSKNVNFTLEARGGIEGRVVSAASGQAVTSFEVTQTRGRRTRPEPWMQQDFTAVSDRDGKFTLERVEAGEATVFVRAAGYEWGYATTLVRPGQTSSDVLVRLEPCAAVEGVVTDSSGSAIQGAAIFAGALPRNEWERERNALTRSGADGAFTLESLPPDTAVLSAHHPDYAGGSAAISNGSAHIVLARGGDIEGYVRVGGQPAAGVSLSAISVDGAGRQSARTDDNGFYVLKALPPGLIQVRGHYGGGGGGRNLEQQAVVEEDKVTEVNFDIAAGTATVAGAVQIENVPAGSIRVTLSVASGSGTEEMTAQVQERDGAYSYSIEGVPAGACTLAAQVYTHNSLRSAAPITLEVRDGQAVRQDIVFPVGGTVRGEVTGPLADSESGVAVLRGADPLPVLDLMSLERLFKERTLGGVQVTAENPSFIIQNIEPGTHTVVVFAIPRDVSSELEALANVRIATAHVEVRENEESRVDLRLP